MRKLKYGPKATALGRLACSMRGNLKSGQILVLVLLVVVVILAIGLSVASRNLTNLRSSTQAEQSQRAFTVAEGGVEDVLSKLNTVANVINSGTGTSGCVRESTDTANCSLPNTDPAIGGTVKVKATKGYEKTLEPGEVAQVNLAAYPAGGTFDIQWVKAGDPAAVTVEFIWICSNVPVSSNCRGETKGNDDYGQMREAYTNSPGSITGTQTGIPDCTGGDSIYSCGLTVTMPNPQNVAILRIKPFWNRTTVKITPTGGSAAQFPVQTYEITSTATTDTGVSRKVEVRRDALPQLPAIFDYVLYSGGDIVK